MGTADASFSWAFNNSRYADVTIVVTTEQPNKACRARLSTTPHNRKRKKGQRWSNHKKSKAAPSSSTVDEDDDAPPFTAEELHGQGVVLSSNSDFFKASSTGAPARAAKQRQTTPRAGHSQSSPYRIPTGTASRS
jgi:hypothetical protein